MPATPLLQTPPGRREANKENLKFGKRLPIIDVDSVAEALVHKETPGYVDFQWQWRGRTRKARATANLETPRTVSRQWKQRGKCGDSPSTTGAGVVSSIGAGVGSVEQGSQGVGLGQGMSPQGSAHVGYFLTHDGVRVGGKASTHRRGSEQNFEEMYMGLVGPRYVHT